MRNFAGHWRSPEKSSVFIRQTVPHVEGWYATRVGSDAALGKRHPLIGFALGDLCGFVVAWEGAASVTSWTGRLVSGPDGSPALHALWHLARAEKGTPPVATALWETFLANVSVFTFVGPDEPVDDPA
jgi:hypothetical protein